MVFDSKLYVMFCKFGKMIICEFIFEGCVLCIGVYNFMLNLICQVVNVLLEKFNNIKLQLICVLNILLLVLNVILVNFKFVISFLNVMCVEVIKMVIFISKYYGLEDVVKE